jgi:FkbM family methyltransferase
LRRAGYEIEGLAAFEPDPTNYSVLAERCAELDAALFPCGVSDTSRRVSFSSGLGPSGRIGDAGASDEIRCVAIDQALPGFRPTLIKMDIEGAEPAALRGAERTIRQHRPGLAISVYHEPDHLWEIPLYVASLEVGYRIFLRGHGHNDYDLVLYCLAP